MELAQVKIEIKGSSGVVLHKITKNTTSEITLQVFGLLETNDIDPMDFKRTYISRRNHMRGIWLTELLDNYYWHGFGKDKDHLREEIATEFKEKLVIPIIKFISSEYEDYDLDDFYINYKIEILKTTKSPKDNQSRIPVRVKKTHEDAIIPSYAKHGDAGFDFYACEDKTILPRDTALVNTGLKMAVPEGFELQIRPRSGMSLNTNIRIANSPGTIDSGYRGEIKIILDNKGTPGFVIKSGDRIAQGVLKRVPVAKFEEVDELGNTERGEGGFGHTGK